MKNTLKSIKEFIKSDWEKTSEEIALLPSKIKKNNLKNLILSKIWSLIFSPFVAVCDMADETCELPRSYARGKRFYSTWDCSG